MSADLSHLDDMPQAIQVLAKQYPAYLCNDAVQCRSKRMLSMLEKIAELNTCHPKYEQDGGAEVLWQDITVVAKTAQAQSDPVMDAVETFLDAVLGELPPETGNIQ